MFCVKCGKQLAEGTSFCPDCGTPLHQENSTQQAAKQQTGSKNKTIAIVIAVIIIICLCIANSSGSSGNTAVSSGNTAAQSVKADPVIGKWTDENAEVVLHIYKDHTGELVSGGWAVKCSWEYNASNQVLTLDFDVLNQPGKVTYNPVKDTLVLSGDTTLYRAD